MILDFLNVFIFLLVGIFMVSFTLLLSKLVHPRKITKEKMIAYECGEDPVGETWIRFNNRFYVIALIFIIFDIEVVFLFPWAVAFTKIGNNFLAFADMMIFLAILLVGFAYVWVKGDLEWVKSYFTDHGEEVLKSPND